MEILGITLLLLVKMFIFLGVFLLIVAYITLLERKVLGHIQNRYGPNRVGPYGLLQPIADGLKLFIKEDVTLPIANKVIFIMAPMITIIATFIPFAVIPFGNTLNIDQLTIMGYTIPLDVAALNKGVLADINIGILYIFAISSLSVYGIVLAGWSSNSKYSLLGGLRSSAQMISYELALGLSIIGVLMTAGSFNLVEIVEKQRDVWFIVYQPLGFILFLVCSFAEAARTPFDLIECESELVSGYQTEYSSMKFAMFYLGEYTHCLFVSCLVTTLFFGGWNGPLLPPVVWFLLKVFFFVFLFIWVRGTFPRLRYDQLMKFGWKFLIPLAFLNIIITAFVMLVI